MSFLPLATDTGRHHDPVSTPDLRVWPSHGCSPSCRGTDTMPFIQGPRFRFPSAFFILFGLTRLVAALTCTLPAAYADSLLVNDVPSVDPAPKDHMAKTGYSTRMQVEVVLLRKTLKELTNAQARRWRPPAQTSDTPVGITGSQTFATLHR